VRLHFVDAKSGVDNWRTSYYLAPITETGADWSAADTQESAPAYVAQPADAAYAPVPGAVLSARACAAWPAQLGDHVYRSAVLDLLRCAALGASGAAGVSEGEFRAQLALRLRERRDAAVADLRAKYAKRVGTVEERLRKAEQRVTREQSEASSQTTAAAISIGGSLLGALFGGRRGAAGKTASAAAQRWTDHEGARRRRARRSRCRSDPASRSPRSTPSSTPRLPASIRASLRSRSPSSASRSARARRIRRSMTSRWSG
jgi:hypothetical protein